MVPLGAGPDRLKPVLLGGLAVFAVAAGVLGEEFVGPAVGIEVVAGEEAAGRATLGSLKRVKPCDSSIPLHRVGRRWR